MNLYTDLPAALRGSALESHNPNDWPKQWVTNNVQHAMTTIVALRHIINLSGINTFVYDLVAERDTVTINLNRTLPTNTECPGCQNLIAEAVQWRDWQTLDMGVYCDNHNRTPENVDSPT